MNPDELTPGRRVIAIGPGTLTGKAGVVVEMPRRRCDDLGYGYDVAVLMDEDNVRDDIAALGFYAHELKVLP